ncbi:putative receptor-like protein kinase At5g39000 [Bidens hawaiensis]|uniref:putative receptor-like protein kinase At5g39000 n=1 Tax=Bidens hawaiensis TaxID=980011 RepID=UPI00404B84FA
MSSSFDRKFNSLKISLEEIKKVTNNFGDENLILQNGSGTIYKGQLERSEKLIDIVVRRFSRKSWRSRKEFMKEIKMLIALKHPNLSTIVGFCDEDDEMIIITKFEAKGSLDQYISDPTLSWTQRLQIRIGIAEALSFIHYDKSGKFSVIHSNVKSSKILLDDKWEPKLFGFELSKIQVVARRQGLVLSRLISGTGAYVDPAYVKSGGVTHKSDVYSLGVVLFEVLCGKKA